MKRLIPILCVMLCLALSIPLAPAAQAAGSYWIGVDLTNQITTIYRTSDNSVVRHMLCSTGLAATPTPTGTFYLPSKAYSSERTEWYYFKEFDCWAKYATRIKGGILFHSVIYSRKDNSSLRSSSVRNLGSRASHGCIRLSVDNAKWIAQNCPVGTKVKIYYGASDPDLKASLTGKYPTLKPGSSGSSVTKLQNQLKACGWYDGSASGQFDSATESAVRAYQAAAGLAVDGQAGSQTQSSLYGSNPKVGMNTTLRQGMNSLAVRQLQSLLKQRGFHSGSVDGSFGAQTLAAVMAYQTAIGEAADGVATPSLQRRLSSDSSVTPPPAVTPEPTPAPVAIGTATVKTNGGTLALRAAASASGKVLARLKNGAKLTVLDTDGDWVKVLSGSQTGYVSARYVKLNLISFETPAPAETATPDPDASPTPVPTPTPTPTPAPVAIGTATGKTHGGTLALRATASASGKVLARLKNGAKLTVLEANGDWVKVLSGSQTGYVSARYVKLNLISFETPAPAETATPGPDATPTPVPTPAPVAIGTATVKTNGGTLALRQSAATSAKVVVKMPKGAKIDLLELVDKDWVKASYKGKTGYASRRYLSISLNAGGATNAPAVTAAPTPAPNFIGTATVRTNGGTLALRQSKSTSATCLIKMPNGAKADVLEADRDWVKLYYKGKTGYARASFLKTSLNGAAATEIPAWPTQSPTEIPAWPSPTPDPTPVPELPAETPTPIPEETPAETQAAPEESPAETQAAPEPVAEEAPVGDGE